MMIAPRRPTNLPELNPIWELSRLPQIALRQRGDNGETRTMRNKVTCGLATIAFTFAVGAAAAAPVDALKAAPDASAMMAHEGAGASGFAGLKSSKNNGLKAASPTDMLAAGATAEGMAQPTSSHWGSGLEALASVAPSALMSSSATHQAIVPAEGAATASGFAAVKEASGLRGAPVENVQSLRSPTAAAENLYRRESK